MHLDIVVYGGADLFVHYFKMIVTAIGTNTFITLRNITLLLAGVTALVSAISRRDFLVCVRWFAIYYLVIYVLFIPRIYVEVLDRTTGLYATNKISEPVPLGLALIAHITTISGDALTQLVDKLASDPQNVQYSKTGMLMSSKMVLASRQFQITDSVLAENMRQFVTQCVFWDIMLNYYTLDSLLTAPNLWEFVKEHATPARGCLYISKGEIRPKVTVCKNVAQLMDSSLKENLQEVALYHGSRIFPDLNQQQAKDLLMTYLPLSYQHLLKTSAGATDILQQSVIANAIMDGGLQLGINSNSQTAVASYTAAKAQEQQRLTQNTIAFQAAYWLPITKNVFEAIMYGCFIFIILLGVFPFGLQVIKNYVMTLIWLQSWSPLYAIINIVCTHYARIYSQGYAHSGFILRDMSGLMQVNHDMASLAGYLTMSVPFIALGLIKGMASTMTSVAQYMGGVSQSTASQAASEAVAGNISMGITGMRNNSSFNVSSYQQDMRARTSTGMSYQLPGGENINFMPDGNFAVDRGGTISELGVDINLAKSIHNSAMKQADEAYNTAKNESIAAGEHYAAGTKDLYSLAEYGEKTKSSGESWAYSENSSAIESLDKMMDITRQFAKDNNITYEHAKDIMSRVNAGLGLKFDGSIGTSGKGTSGTGISGGVDANLRTEGHVQDVDKAHELMLYKKAESFAEKTGLSKHIDVATKATHDRSFNSNNVQGARILEQAEGHFDASQSLRNEVAINIQRSQGLREVASHAQENAININVKANNDFLKEISNERSMGGKPKGIITAIADLRDPEMARIMADNYARNWANRHLEAWNKGNLPSSVGDITQSFQDNKKAMSKEVNQDLLHERYMGYKGNVKDSAKQMELTPEGSVDESIRNKVEGNIANHIEEIHRTKNQLDEIKNMQEQKFKDEAAIAKQNREYGAMYTAKRTVASINPFSDTKKPSDEIKEKLDE